MSNESPKVIKNIHVFLESSKISAQPVCIHDIIALGEKTASIDQRCNGLMQLMCFSVLALDLFQILGTIIAYMYMKLTKFNISISELLYYEIAVRLIIRWAFGDLV